MSSGPGQVVVVGRAQEAEAVGQDLEHALAVDEAVLLGLRLQDGEDQLLLAHRRRALDVEVARELRELVDLLLLEDLEVQTRRGLPADHAARSRRQLHRSRGPWRRRVMRAGRCRLGARALLFLRR